MTNLRTVSEILREFDEKLDNYYINRWSMHQGRGYLHGVVDATEIKSFLSSSLKQLLEQVVPKKMGGRVDYDDASAWNACRQQVLDRINAILK